MDDFDQSKLKNKPSDFEVKDEYYSHSEAEEDIIKFVKNKGVSWVTEIYQNLGLSDTYAKTRIVQLVKAGRLKKLKLNPEVVPNILLKRINDLWNRGIKGYDRFCMMYFVVPADHIEPGTPNKSVDIPLEPYDLKKEASMKKCVECCEAPKVNCSHVSKQVSKAHLKGENYCSDCVKHKVGFDISRAKANAELLPKEEHLKRCGKDCKLYRG